MRKTCYLNLGENYKDSLVNCAGHDSQAWSPPHPATASGASPSISESHCCLSSGVRREFSLHLYVLLNYFGHGLGPQLLPLRSWQHWNRRKIRAAKLPVDSVRKAMGGGFPSSTLQEGITAVGKAWNSPHSPAPTQEKDTSSHPPHECVIFKSFPDFE